MKSKISHFKQHYTGRGIGGLMDTYQRSAGILMVAQYIALIIVLYTTSLHPFFTAYLPWMTFTTYMIIAFVIIALVMIIAYTVVAPSHYAFWNQQIWQHDNPLRIKLERLERNQKKIMEKLGIDNEE